MGDNVIVLDNGNYIVKSNNWDNGSVINPGATTYGNGKVGVSGTINSCNSIIGTTASSSQTVVFNSILDNLFVGYQRGKYFVIHNGTVLAADDTEATQTVANDPVTFLSDCSGIGKLAPAGVGTAVSGTVTAKVRVESSAPVINQPYVRRYYDVSPETNASTATGKLTLFYTQADFDDFNTNRGTAPALPVNPLDLTGIGNLRITQKHGTSTTGTPESYTGWTGSGPKTVLINPNDQDIFWNSVEKRWEVTFSVTGFSGFFAHSNIDETALPVSLISFTAQRVEKNAFLQWTTAAETNASHFEIERSTDGKSYSGIGSVQALGSQDAGYRYSFTDTQFSDLATVAYYRLRSVDMDGSYALSRAERVLPENNTVLTYVYPNPVKAGTYVPVKFSSNVHQVQVLDLQGRQLSVQVNRNNGPFVLDPLSQGMYLIRFDAGKGSETRKLVVE
ncbi:hypothetical protein DYBT9275_01188 [Dyadobacter sp. CECT 9275]|uniref:Secretion system C-terminal sorting domain-containing protein n=1 Tax=Dyadobacter helix TaxID=2822344 RepID=A0A916J9R5_9BACT|nr:T9SS type A sorting domain-containing protein [Dyadobacter sp. CECT 9275]CAG4993544.1 hypothetical protein DYBT9275_01188 [Dyadobacter sp. CECT 9275]